MSHPAELIARIRTVLEKDYPADLYQYSIEQMIPGTRMYPDILVRDQGGNMRCAVEIGYTRPEKLTAYRKIHCIPDVRWYDKSGVLHADVEQRLIKATVTLEPQHPFSLYIVHNQVPCFEPDCCELPEAISEVEDAEYEELLAAAHDDVLTAVVTDWEYAWFASFCDKCGRYWLCDDGEAIVLMTALDDYQPREFGREYGGRVLHADWSAMVKEVREIFSLDLEYENGYPIRFGSTLRQTVFTMRDSAIRRER